MNEVPHAPSIECHAKSAGRLAESYSALNNASDDEFTRFRLLQIHTKVLQDILAQCGCFQFFSIDPLIAILSHSPTLSERASSRGMRVIK